MSNFKNFNLNFLLRKIVADCDLVPPKFRLTCIVAGDLGVRYICEQSNEHVFWLQFQMDYATGQGRRDVNWILCTSSHDLEFAIAMHAFLGVDPEKVLAAVGNDSLGFAYVDMLRNRYAVISTDLRGAMAVVGCGRDAAVRTFNHNVNSIKSGVVGLPHEVLQFVEGRPSA